MKTVLHFTAQYVPTEHELFISNLAYKQDVPNGTWGLMTIAESGDFEFERKLSSLFMSLN